MSDFLDGKTIVIMGVANKRSIAWGCTQAIMNQGAKVVLTYQNNRIKKSLKRFVPEDLDLLECDVSEDENIEKAFAEIGDRYVRLTVSFMPLLMLTRIH
jgi:enoyl-[acyl-carrier protein] reductase I